VLEGLVFSVVSFGHRGGKGPRPPPIEKRYLFTVIFLRSPGLWWMYEPEIIYDQQSSALFASFKEDAGAQKH